MIFEDDLIYIEREFSEIPWVKIFAKSGVKELSECDERTLKRLFDATLITEKTMIEFYKPEKINIASFANYVPKVHIHVMARFKEDSFFPESMWSKKQRDGNLTLPEFDEFAQILKENLK
ncbi:MAG: HIT family protein [Campylobacteraceae bacterium]|nr:HIT family protein [Campylobacteraceae bacterium]